MRNDESLAHTCWDCRYHVVLISKKHRKLICGKLRRHLEEIFHELAKRTAVKIVEGHLRGRVISTCVSTFRRNTRYSMWLATSMEKVQSPSPRN
uniref:transposase n=1 Tax=Marinobacterium profundum TaxID=1714300 RepID=UPI003F710385